MARAVDFREFTPRNSRDDLIRTVEQAPVEHAQAMLAAYDLLQRLHEKGSIDAANGLLSASETVVDRLVDVVSSKPAGSALRVGLMLSITGIDRHRPDALLAVCLGSKTTISTEAGERCVVGRRTTRTVDGGWPAQRLW